MTDRPDVPAEILAALRPICLRLPEAYEEDAWVGTRWRVRKRTFAHVLMIAGGWPPAYARAADDDGPVCVFMFRSRGAELGVLRASGRPFFAPVWRSDEVGMILDENSDWDEVVELVTESYCALAPRALREQVR
jgi:hypothetical protein